MQLYEAGRKYNISAILLPMPGYIDALPWAGCGRRCLLANLYITDGPEEVRKAALAKLMAAPADLYSVLEHPRSTDVVIIMKQAFPTSLPLAVHYLRCLKIPQLCYQSASDVLAHLTSLACGPACTLRDGKELILAVENAVGMTVGLASNVRFHNGQYASGYHPTLFSQCIRSLLYHQLRRRMNPPGSDDWSGYLSCCN